MTEEFCSQQRNSFEAVLRFLLGEQSLEESLRWLKKSRSESDRGIGQGLSSSSDDDDEALGRYARPEVGVLELNDPLVALNNAQCNVPLPKACGALWAGNGRLVCFFPIKQEKETSLLGQSLTGNIPLQKGSRDLFEGFGRLNSTNYRQKRVVSTAGTTVVGESDDDDFELSSSETSSSSDGLGLSSHHFMPTVPWTGSAARISQDFAIDASQRSIGDTGQPSTVASKASMVVSIRDYSKLLCVKECLGRKYVIHGGHSAAIHNANVARNFGFEDLADAWAFASLILQDKVPVQTLRGPNLDECFHVMMRHVVSPPREQRNSIELSLGVRENALLSEHLLPVQWAGHPFGRGWLVDAM